MKHYPIYDLDRYRHGEMPYFSRFLCRLHLAGCRRCREDLHQLAEDDLLLRQIRESIQSLDTPKSPGEYRRLCDIFQEVPGSHSTV